MLNRSASHRSAHNLSAEPPCSYRVTHVHPIHRRDSHKVAMCGILSDHNARTFFLYTGAVGAPRLAPGSASLSAL